MAGLECAANEVVELESRAEAAEAERDEAAEQLRAATPRPGANWEELRGLVGEPGGREGGGRGAGTWAALRAQCVCRLGAACASGLAAAGSDHAANRRPTAPGAGIQRFQAALDAHKLWPSEDLAALLAGAPLHAADAGGEGQAEAGGGSSDVQPEDGAAGTAAEGGSSASSDESSSSGRGGSHLSQHVHLGLGCLRAAVVQGALTRQDVEQVGLGGCACSLFLAGTSSPASL